MIKQNMNYVDPQAVRRRYDGGESTTDLAKRYNVSKEFIIKFMRKHNIALRDRLTASNLAHMQGKGNSYSKLDTEENINEIRRLYLFESISQCAIAKKFGVKDSTIYNFLKRHNIKRGDNSMNNDLIEKKPNEGQDTVIEVERPTTTRGKTLEKLEVKQEESLLLSICKKLELQKDEHGELETKRQKFLDYMRELEASIRDNQMKPQTKLIAKKKLELAQLEKDEMDVEISLLDKAITKNLLAKRLLVVSKNISIIENEIINKCYDLKVEINSLKLECDNIANKS
jgi:transposase